MLLQIYGFAYWFTEENKTGCRRKLNALLVSTSIYTKLWVTVQNVHCHLFLNTWAGKWKVLVYIKSGLLTLSVSWKSYKKSICRQGQQKSKKQNKKRKCDCKLNSNKDFFFLHHQVRPSFHSCPKRIYIYFI